MYQTEYLPRLIFLLKICKLLSCHPFEWDAKSDRLIQCRSPIRIGMFKLQCLLSVGYCTTQGLNIFFGPLTTIEKFQGFGIFMTYLLASTIRWNYNLDNGPSQVIHAFLDVEATLMFNLPHLPASLETKAVKLYIQLCDVCIPAFPVLLFILLRVAPCTPPFILSMLLGCQDADTCIGSYLGVHIFEAWMSAHIVYSAGIVACYVFFVGIVFILNFLRVLESHITNQLGDHSDYIRLYRVVQILEKSLNAHFSERILPAIMFCNPVVEIFGLFVCISLSKDIPMPGFLVFPLMTTITGINNILIVALASKFHSSSGHVLAC
ncbi:hypothetical protein Fcan01_25070 [Folsomia candida]|uniref:Uncharacterized protein n=1 Tax=Folsomia candida TaxID=158441 RepID=A0A226D6A9_FOLCA|nr:hypothetical protein Fcan01_25070 [Folsomia candida]